MPAQCDPAFAHIHCQNAACTACAFCEDYNGKVKAAADKAAAERAAAVEAAAGVHVQAAAAAPAQQQLQQQQQQQQQQQYIHADAPSRTALPAAWVKPAGASADAWATLIGARPIVTGGEASGVAKGPVVGGGPVAGWLAEHGQIQVTQPGGALRVSGNTRAYLVEDFRSEGWGQHKYVRIDVSSSSGASSSSGGGGGGGGGGNEAGMESALTFEIDVSRVPCGCLATVYLVAMPDPTLAGVRACCHATERKLTHIHTQHTSAHADMHRECIPNFILRTAARSRPIPICCIRVPPSACSAPPLSVCVPRPATAI